MSISDTTENAILNLALRAVAWANYADNAATSPQTNHDVALHTADPGDTGTLATSEAAYGNYARAQIARTTGGWSAASGGSCSPAANIVFPTGNAGPGVGTHWSFGKTGGGAQAYLWSGTVTPNITFGNGVQPQLSTATTVTLD